MNICLVTDRRQLCPEARTTRDEVVELTGFLEQAVAAGVDLIQLREPDLPGRTMTEVARWVRVAAGGTSTRVVVNDRADVAIASACDGVHLRGDGPPVARVRTLSARPGWIVGRSVHTVDEARDHADADYLIFGAVFGSGSKPGLGLDALRTVATAGSRIIAIGGMTVDRARACVAAGASGVAAIRLFLPPGRAEGALGVAAACGQLRDVFDAAGTGHLQ